MPMCIRLALHGCANRPFFHIVVSKKHRARNSKPVETLGSFDPMVNKHNEKLVGINFDRLRHWLANGAQPSKPVEVLLGLSGFFPIHPMTKVTAKRNREAALKQDSADPDADTSANEGIS